MNRRLPPQPGEWIDRERPIDFRFEGRPYQGLQGDVLSSALWCHDVRVQGRSFKYHRPRGPYSFAGDDANVLVEDRYRTNLRGDLLLIEPEMDVRAVNTRGGTEGDWLNITEKFSRFLPVGFYYKAFYSPRRLFGFYERQMRKMAGLGTVNPGSPRKPSPKDYAFCDVCVVGAGLSGLNAAWHAAQSGLRVMVVDEQQRGGGSLNWQSPTDQTRADRWQLLQQCTEHKNVEVRTGTMAGGWYQDHWIALFDQQRLTKLRARATIIATGCVEQPAVFQNNDLPGVMLAGATQRLIHQYAVRPFERAVVLTTNDEGYRAALDLLAAGVTVPAIVDLRGEGPAAETQSLHDAGVEVNSQCAIVEAVAGPGKRSLRAARVCRCEGQEPRLESLREVPCDGIVLSTGWSPNGGMLYQAGARFGYDDAVHQLVPRSLPAGVFAAGRVNGVFEYQDKRADGKRAGLAAAAYLGSGDGTVADAVPRASRPHSHPYPIVAIDAKGKSAKKNFVDFDEDLPLPDFKNAWQEGYDNIELMKRYTTVGMGPSQGKLSNMNAIRVLARLNEATIDETGSTTSRPFHRPVSLSHLAGQSFHPLRRTPIHGWHVQRNAEMVHAGNWLRPDHYRVDGRDRLQCVLDEALAVRHRVGLIDVSTLGKLMVNGADAASFLEWIYIGRFAKQSVGRIRYAVACDESGVIIEDGVVVRQAEDRFYVTATSSGVAGFYREMQRWALLTKMNVTLANLTGHVAAFNLAGPHSRQVLASLTDIDLSDEAFPYLQARRAVVAGVDVELLRVGFVGELGFELHVPTDHALDLWNALNAAGEAVGGVRPFGVEAQRLLRLEKGHLIVGQDTDSLTHPYEADLAWAIGKNKSPFVGSRSLEVVRQQPLTRKLVGLVFPEGETRVQDCHLLIRAGEIVGRVTSVAPFSTLTSGENDQRGLALAFLSPDLEEPGTPVQIRVSDGSLIEATVAALPFYDPDNLRQTEALSDASA